MVSLQEKLAALRPEHYLHQTRLRVRYSETDQMGVVYYSRYAEYCEVARTDWIRHLGLSYARIERELGVLLPVRHFAIDYHRPAYYEDELLIYTWLPTPPGTKFTFEHLICRGEEILAEARVLLIFISAETWRPCRPPEAFYAALAQKLAS